ncbi:MAG: putative C4-dicarboxylate/malic acid transporter [Aureobasidium pullulans]|nr:MAG: putative C4-dicarboxylate/malic acid transporter [Aureobasidium pullulans]
MANLGDHMHPLNGLEEDFAYSRTNPLPGSDHEYIDRNVPPPDQRPPALGYMPLPEPRAELSQSFSPDSYHFADRRTERRTDRSFSGKPLSLRTMTNTTSMPEYTYLDRANTDSPSQRAHSIHAVGSIPPSIYPLLRPEGTSEDAVSSSRTDRRLPSFHQLSKIADSATEASDTRPIGLPNLSTYAGQIVAQSASTSHLHFPPSQQSSPSTNFMLLGHPSPTNTRTDDTYANSHSPASFTAPNNFDSRRKPAHTTRPPPFIPTMTSSSIGTASSTETMGSLQSHQNSDAGGYSTNHTTPMESTPSSLDGTPKSSGISRLQPSTSAAAGFPCEYPGCTAPPFQTQYLLNSHANVHSSSRPHYCPVKGCPRGEGGKGFKRKNEMIRHGHVRVHHVDKDKDDPLLREVLAQRPEGGGRGRRRRAGPA